MSLCHTAFPCGHLLLQIARDDCEPSPMADTRSMALTPKWGCRTLAGVIAKARCLNSSPFQGNGVSCALSPPEYVRPGGCKPAFRGLTFGRTKGYLGVRRSSPRHKPPPPQLKRHFGLVGSEPLSECRQHAKHDLAAVLNAAGLRPATRGPTRPGPASMWGPRRRVMRNLGYLASGVQVLASYVSTLSHAGKHEVASLGSLVKGPKGFKWGLVPWLVLPNFHTSVWFDIAAYSP